MTSVFDIFKAAARQTWRVRALWPLGMLAALFGQGEYGFNANVSQRVSAPTGSGFPGEGLPGPLGDGALEGWLAWIADNIVLWVALVLAVTLVWWLVAAFVGWLAQGALIAMVDGMDTGGRPTIRDALRRGRERVLPLVLLSILLALPALIAGLVALAALAPVLIELFRSAGDPSPEVIIPSVVFGFLCAFPLILLAALGGVVLQVVNKVAARCCVIEGLGARASARRGWQLIRSNLGDTIVSWLLLGVIGVVFSVAAVIPALVLLAPLAQALFSGQWSGWATASAALLVVYAVVVGVVVGGMLTSFNSAVWTKLYRQFLTRAPAGG